MVDEENGVTRQFWSCPVRFIPESVCSFITHYRYYQSHPSAAFPSLEKVSPRYRQAEIVYEGALAECNSER
jgi:hypothetical protein